jgi:hypothetical protein
VVIVRNYSAILQAAGRERAAAVRRSPRTWIKDGDGAIDVAWRCNESLCA